VHQVPVAGREGRGKPIVNLLTMGPDEQIASVVPVREFSAEKSLIFATRLGVVKKTPLAAYSHVRAVGVNALNVDPGDALIDVQITSGNDEIILATRNGMAIRFHESDVRNMGRTATGVRGVRLRADDFVVGMVVIHNETAAQSTLLVVTEQARGKRTAIDEYRFQSRGGSGVINFRVTDQTGRVVAIKEVFPGDELMLITRAGVINRQRVNEIRVIGRATQGVRLLSLDEGDVLVDVARLVPEDDAGEAAISGNGASGDGGGTIVEPPDAVVVAEGDEVLDALTDPDHDAEPLS
jgi:DNA gyrase subunit A